MQLNCTGFVSQDAGSVSSANGELLKRLLGLGHSVNFFTKPSFVNPQAFIEHPKLKVVDCTNHRADGLRLALSKNGQGLGSWLLGRVDSHTYNRGLARRLRAFPHGDVDFWLGDWAHGKSSRPVVSLVQGPPGTDARSVWDHQELIKQLSGQKHWLKLALYATYRIKIGLPKFHFTDHAIVGSEWSRQELTNRFSIDPKRTHALPYSIDLDAFQPKDRCRPVDGALRLFWLGRFVPRKRLDVFLNGLAAAIRAGVNVEAWVVGQSGFVPGYEKLIEQFPYPDRLQFWAKVPRSTVPDMLAQVDVMAQPSQNEDFGSSVAEALACGVPAIVGHSNGTADYICDRSIKLSETTDECFAEAIAKMAELKRTGGLMDAMPSRQVAARWFAPPVVAKKLEAILADVSLSRPSQRR